MTGMRTSTLYFYVSFLTLHIREDPVKGTKGKKKKTKLGGWASQKNLAEEASSYITGSGEEGEGGNY